MTEPKFTYEVTEDGKVFSLSSNWRGYGKRELVQYENSYGYMRVRLVTEQGRKSKFVHLLVAEKFLPPKPNDQHQIRHLDGNKKNNAASNLEWGTAKENADDREAHGNTKRGATHGMAVLSEKDVIAIRESGATHVSLANQYGVTPVAIAAVRKRLSWRHI